MPVRNFSNHLPHIADAPLPLIEDFGLGLRVQEGWKHHACILHTVTDPYGNYVDAYIERKCDGKKRKVARKEDIEDLALSLNNTNYSYGDNASTRWA